MIEIQKIADKYIDIVSTVVIPDKNKGDDVGAIIAALRDRGYEITKLPQPPKQGE